MRNLPLPAMCLFLDLEVERKKRSLLTHFTHFLRALRRSEHYDLLNLTMDPPFHNFFSPSLFGRQFFTVSQKKRTSVAPERGSFYFHFLPSCLPEQNGPEPLNHTQSGSHSAKGPCFLSHFARDLIFGTKPVLLKQVAFVLSFFYRPNIS